MNALATNHPAPSSTCSRSWEKKRPVTGQIAESPGSLWLELDGRLALRIEHADLHYFRGLEPQNAGGAALEAHGMIYRRNGQLRMRIRHPADLPGLPTDTGTAAAGPQSEEIFQ